MSAKVTIYFENRAELGENNWEWSDIIAFRGAMCWQQGWRRGVKGVDYYEINEVRRDAGIGGRGWG